MRLKKRWAAIPAALLALILSVGGVALAITPSEPESGGGVSPYILDEAANPGGNVTCIELGYENSSARANYTGGNSFDAAFPAGISVTVTGGVYVDWTSTFGIGAVIVKGSNAANIYAYSPASLGDSGLASPVNAGGGAAGLSNLTFCWDDQEEEEECPLAEQIPAGSMALLTEIPEETCPGEIIVDKVTLPEGSPQSFDFVNDWGADFALTDAAAPYQSGPLPPGDYAVVEAAEDGWELTDAFCLVLEDPGTIVADSVQLVEGMDPEDIVLESGQTVYCRFENTRAGRIIVEKVAANAPAGYEFEFGPSWAPDFYLGHGGSEDSGLLAPGTYSVSETLSPGFILGGLVCEDESGGTSVDLGTGTATIDLAAGETVTCTFTNRMVEQVCPEEPSGPIGITPALAALAQIPETPAPVCTGEIIVVKETLPDGAEGAFQFDPSWGAHFLLADGEWHASGQIPVGVYSVTEVSLPAGWSLVGAVCSDGSSRAAIGLSAHETVTCTFYNALPGQIIVDKVTDPAGSLEAFEFDPSWGANFALTDAAAPVASGPLAAAQYSVAEVNLPAGWSLDSAVCSDGSAPGSIDLSDGETVTCTFHNSLEQVAGPEGSLTILKATNPAGGEGFGFTTSANLSGPFTLDDGGSMLFGELEPGAYTVTEDAPAGDWQFQSVVCEALDWSAAGSAVTVNLAEGEVAVCTFYNVQELPYTGSPSWLLPLLAAGLGTLLVGLGLVLVPAVRRRG